MAPKITRVLALPANAKRVPQRKVEKVLKPGIVVKTATKQTSLKLQAQPLREKLAGKKALPVCQTLQEGQAVVVTPAPTSRSRKDSPISSSSDSSSTVVKSNKKQKNLVTRAKYRRRTYVDLLLEGKDKSSLSLLEKKAVGTATEKMYKKEYQAFTEWVGPTKLLADHGRESGPTHHRLHEREVLDGSPGLCGRPANSKLDASSPSVQPHWRLPHSIRGLFVVGDDFALEGRGLHTRL
eukprot:symbB.v1.2.024902.t1/scaffold2390.1/size80330/1